MSTTNLSNDPGTAPRGPGESSDVKDQARQAAGTASDEGQRVAGVAQTELKSVTAEAQNQLRGLLDQATSQVDAQSRQQQGRLAQTVRTFGDDLHGLTQQQNSNGLAGQLVQQVAEQAHGLATQLENREPRELLEDVRGFARSRTGTFLLGALVAGIAVGRVARGAKTSQDATSAGADHTSVPSGTATQPRPVTTNEFRATAEPEGFDGTSHDADLGLRGAEISEAGVASASRGPA
ncbi:MAG: hypothetical protein ABIR34_08865 [Marmoricola sp.]